MVRKAISRRIKGAEHKLRKVEVIESCRFNLKVEILIRSSTKFSMDDLSHVARRVAETRARSDDLCGCRGVPARF